MKRAALVLALAMLAGPFAGRAAAQAIVGIPAGGVAPRPEPPATIHSFGKGGDSDDGATIAQLKADIKADMREIARSRLEVEADQVAAREALKDYVQAIRRFGKDSPQAGEAKADLEQARQALRSAMRRLRQAMEELRQDREELAKRERRRHPPRPPKRHRPLAALSAAKIQAAPLMPASQKLEIKSALGQLKFMNAAGHWAQESAGGQSGKKGKGGRR